MSFGRKLYLGPLGIALIFISGCRNSGPPGSSQTSVAHPVPLYYRVDPANTGAVSGKIRFTGKLPPRKVIDMSGDPACVAAHKGKAFDESLAVGPGSSLGNVFVYISKGLEGKEFEPPSTPVILDQRGCWFHPHVLGIQVGQVLQVVNSDPVTHNIHPMGQINREWNHSQGPGDDPISRKFTKSEIMISVKCNIHSWMHAFIGVLDHPYYSVSKDDGTFTISNIPPGIYDLSVWQEKLGTQTQQITVTKGQDSAAEFTFK